MQGSSCADEDDEDVWGVWADKLIYRLSCLCVPLQVWLEKEEEEEEEGEEGDLKGAVVFCMQAEHAGTRTYYFSADSHEEQEEWITAMSEAARVNVQPAQRWRPHTLHWDTLYI